MSATGGHRLVRAPAEPARPPALDDAQRAVVAHTDGPLLVVGGPGTGKTSSMVEAAVARVEAGIDPQRVLVLTFGRRAAAALRVRIERRVVEAGAASPPLVRTFHGYAFGLLRQHAASRGEPTPRLLTGPEQDVVIRELVAGSPERWPARLRAALPTFEFARQLRDLLLRAAERGIDAPALAAYGDKLGRDDWRAAAEFKTEYESVLALRDATAGSGVGYDYAELVRAAADLLRGEPELLASQRRRLVAVYVDEFAETDPAQRELLELVAGGGGTLVGFADPDSSTFGFRGGDPAGVREFPERFRTATGDPAPVLMLHRCYRGSPPVLAGVMRVGRRLRGPARHRVLISAGPGGSAGGSPGDPPGAASPVAAEPEPGSVGSRDSAGSAPGSGGSAPSAGSVPESRGRGGAVAAGVEVRRFRSPVTEHSWLAHRLREIHLRERVPWSRMAVLVRAGDQLPRVRRALRAVGVPTAVEAADLPLPDQPAVAPLLWLLRCAIEPERLDEEAAVALLHSPLGGADPFTERRLRQGLRALAAAAGDLRPSGELLVEALRDPAELAMVQRRWAAPARSVAHLLTVAQQAASAPGATAEQVLWEVWQASGLASRWFAAATSAGREQAVPGSRAEAADRDLDAVMMLFDAAARFTDRLPGAGVAVFLDYLQSQQLPADSLAATADRGEAVRLLTAHAAKGLEWDVIALPGVQEGVWPDLRLRGSLLGSEQLVDLHAGREPSPVGQRSALLDEERRLFYVAVSRARRRVLATAVAADSVGGEFAEEPSRFLRELAPVPPVDQHDPPVDRPPGAHPGPGGPFQPAGGAGAATGGDPAAAKTMAGEPAGADTAGADSTGGDPAGGDQARGDVTEGDRVSDHGRLAGGVESEQPEPAVGLSAPALTLPALVAELRRAVVDRTTPRSRRQAAAAQLARLAAAGVPGADPEQWWGLAPISDDRPVVDPDQPVRVSPSAIESALRCSLRWLLERHGGAAPATAAQGVGNLVHATAMLADKADVDRAALIEWLGARFDAIEHAARWLAGRERDRAEQMVDKLIRWVAGNPRRLLAIEQDFTVRLGRVELRGRVDRLEIDPAGRLVVVDLKTGKQAPAGHEIDEHPQLGAYQAAVAAGGFAEYGAEPGGAALVQLGTSAGQAREQAQPPLAEAGDPEWAGALIRRTGAVMAGATFTAVRNNRCRTCPVRTSCPISGQGRQVVQP